MVSIWRSLTVRNLATALLLLIPAVGLAADFDLLWDPNCNGNDNLEGYYIHYIKENSVILNPNDATKIYVPLSKSGFDPEAPRYLVSGLIDDVKYCFAVSAWYGDEESGLSNEICGVNGADAPSPSSSASKNSGSGCFINALK
jgi:hypothetical protein